MNGSREGVGAMGAFTGSIGKTGMLFPAEPRRRLTSSFIERGNLDCGGDLGQTLRMPGGKLWSISVLVPSCPSQSLTSVAAIHCLVASWPERARLDPAGEFV